jgi:hypothetical protein
MSTNIIKTNQTTDKIEIIPNKIIIKIYENFYTIDDYKIDNSYMLKGIWNKFSMNFTNYIIDDTYKKIYTYDDYIFYSNIYDDNKTYTKFIIINSKDKQICYNRLDLDYKVKKLYSNINNKNIHFTFTTNTNKIYVLKYTITAFDINVSY